ncbi:subclass B1 metallo-beta-lactamase [Alkaliphilus peptidifermentans]|uniref:beta-lactamase n=1 Tax=Alkaliphilus peptidifermentans DSM 18978 TaxID=1120976 RepID=A0A1G5E8Z0_9FIRM|nr:subclass B1 metallo-beta-lactamase [Alkaliphilus peptidifermentans]SCY23449.1 metallo-beta-lactamase class B [Alkaliphilus peptidifermentans DSM 18978]
MKRFCKLIIILIVLLSLVGCNKNGDISQGKVEVFEEFYKSGSSDENYIELYKINDTIWVHTSYSIYNGYRVPSNGIVAISSNGLILVDTPWNNEQTRELLTLTKDVFKKDISIAIITHAHEDRIGGIDTLLENQVDVRSTSMTVKEAEKRGFNKPQPKLDSEPNFSVGNIDVEVFYPGEGHTVDNITVWFPQYKVLFGGCFIKSLDSKDKGNIEDANVQQWPYSVKNLLEKYPDAEVVIPGHGEWGSIDLIKHTLKLVSE